MESLHKVKKETRVHNCKLVYRVLAGKVLLGLLRPSTKTTGHFSSALISEMLIPDLTKLLSKSIAIPTDFTNHRSRSLLPAFKNTTWILKNTRKRQI